MSAVALEAESHSRSRIPVTAHVAAKASSLRYEQLPAEIVELARQTLLDWLAVAIAGSRQELPRILGEEAQDQGGRPVATLVGHGFKTSIQQAALVNGATSHALDYDDTNFVAYGHCGVVIIPAIFALAEHRNASGKDFVPARTPWVGSNCPSTPGPARCAPPCCSDSTATIGS